MKTILLIPVIILYALSTTQGQTDSTARTKIYHIWIKPMETGRIQHGFLYEVKDSSLTILRSYNMIERREGNFEATTFDSRNIDVVELRKKNKKGLGILIGGLSGITLGALTGYLIANPHEHNLKDGISNAVTTISVSALIVGLGFITGTVIGGSKISIPVEGSQEQFELNKSMLNDYSIKFNPRLGGTKIQTFSKLRDEVVDADSNVYHTLALGGQVWMAEDLKVTHYRDGSPIQDISREDPGSGIRYNWSAVQDSRKLCPAGWHIPSITEWTSLYNSLGGRYAASDAMMKEFSTPAGSRTGHWWSSTEQDAAHAKSIYLEYNTIGIMFTATDKNSGLEVRCMRD